MKTIKKLLLVIVAFVMSFAIAICAACTPVASNDDKNNDQTQTGDKTDTPPTPDEGDTKPVNPTPDPDDGDEGDDGNDDDDDGNKTDPEPDEGDEPVNPTPTPTPDEKTDLEKVIDALTVQSASYAQLNVTSEIDNSYKFSIYDTTETTPSDTSSNKEHVIGTATGKLNILDGDMDLFTESVSEYGTYYSYVFARDWALSVYDSEEKVTDFAGKTLMSVGSLKDMIAANDLFALILGDVDLGELASAMLLPVSGASVIALADSFDALTVNGNEWTVDVNLLIYNMVQSVNNFLKTLSNTTTIGELLAKNEVKGLINAFTAGYDGASLQALLAATLAEVAQMPVGSDGENTFTVADMFTTDITTLAVAADANSTAYEYIVKVISSNELKNIISEYLSLMMQTEFTLPCTVDCLVINDLLGAATEGGLSVSALQEGFAGAIADVTATQLPSFGNNAKTPLPEGYTPPVKGSSVQYMTGCSVTYTVVNNKLTKMVAGFTQKADIVDVNYNGGYSETDKEYVVTQWYVSETSSTTTEVITFTFVDTAFELTDLSDSEFGSNDNPPVSGDYIKPEDGKYVIIGATANGEYADMDHTDNDYVVIDKDGSFIIVYTDNEGTAEPTIETDIIFNGTEYVVKIEEQTIFVEYDGKCLYLVNHIPMDDTVVEVRVILKRV